MERDSPSHPGSRPERWAWIPILAVLVLCWPLICCCCLALGGVALLLGPPQSNVVPPAVTGPAVPLGPDPQAEPVYGSVRLQRGFSPDPYLVEAVAGGPVDSAASGRNCGFITSRPTFTFQWRGGASESFLRLFFTARDEESGTSLLVHTPDGEWLCETASLTGAGPVVDLPFAPSGEYAVWTGTGQPGASAAGTLSITSSQDETP